MSTVNRVAALDFFEEEPLESSVRMSSCRKDKRNDVLFNAIKTRMIMRLYGVSAKKARQILASRIMDAKTLDK